MPNHLQLCGSPMTKDFLVHTCVCVHAQSLQSCLTVCDPVNCQAPLSMGLSRQEYWSGLLCSRGSSRPRDLSCISCVSCIAGRFFATEPPRGPWLVHTAGQIALPLSPEEAGCEEVSGRASAVQGL